MGRIGGAAVLAIMVLGGRGAAAAEPACGAGYAVKAGACLRIDKADLPDAALYEQGKAMALSGRYAEALALLRAVREPRHAGALTMRGFALRKQGRFDDAMVLYRQALAVEPDNADTHEYVGEGYVSIGRVDLARMELVELGHICGGPGCDQYDDLARAIQTRKTE